MKNVIRFNFDVGLDSRLDYNKIKNISLKIPHKEIVQEFNLSLILGQRL